MSGFAAKPQHAREDVCVASALNSFMLHGPDRGCLSPPLIGCDVLQRIRFETKPESKNLCAHSERMNTTRGVVVALRRTLDD